MGRIIIKGMEFFAHHGFYPEEAKLGNRFLIDIEIKTMFTGAMVEDDLSETIDYCKIYSLVQKKMSERVNLLEHLGYLIVEEIRATYPRVNEIQLTLKKMNPPLGGLVHYSAVRIDYPVDFM